MERLRQCEWCGNTFSVDWSNYKKRFCGHSCAMHYNNKHAPRLRGSHNNRGFVRTVDAYVDDCAAEMEVAMTAIMWFPLQTLPPKRLRLWNPVRHTYYIAQIASIR